MKQINLLPASIRDRQTNRQRTIAASIGVVAGLALCAGIYLPLKVQVSTAQSHVADLTSMTGTSGVSGDAAAQAAQDDLILRIGQLNVLAKSEVNWQRAFHLVGTFIPQDVTLTNYSYGSAASNVTLTLSGKAQTNLGFAVFMQSLQANKSLTAIKVGGYTYDPVLGGVTFSVLGSVPLSAIDYSSK